MRVCFFIICLCLITVKCYALGETESMSCKGGIVSRGQTMLTIVQKCGQPVAKTPVASRYKYAGKIYRGTEEWLYNFGPNEFQYVVIFNGSTATLMFSTRDHGF